MIYNTCVTFAAFLLSLFVLPLNACGDETSTDKPNIVFVLADNLGYGELGCYGGGILRGALLHPSKDAINLGSHA